MLKNERLSNDIKGDCKVLALCLLVRALGKHGRYPLEREAAVDISESSTLV